jgi:hypothetical protein
MYSEEGDEEAKHLRARKYRSNGSESRAKVLRNTSVSIDFVTVAPNDSKYVSSQGSHIARNIMCAGVECFGDKYAAKFLNLVYRIASGTTSPEFKRRVVVVVGGDRDEGSEAMVRMCAEKKWPFICLQDTGELEQALDGLPNVTKIPRHCHPTELASVIHMRLISSTKGRFKELKVEDAK